MSAGSIPANGGRVTLKQGAGGRAMRALIERLFIKDFAEVPFEGVGLAAMDDGAAIPFGDEWLVITTDSPLGALVRGLFHSNKRFRDRSDRGESPRQAL